MELRGQLNNCTFGYRLAPNNTIPIPENGVHLLQMELMDTM